MNWKHLINRIYHHRYGRWLLHLLLWVFMFAATYYISNIAISATKIYARGVALNCLYSTLNTAIAYYLLVYLVYERLLKRKKRLAAILVFVLVVFLYASLNHVAELLLLQDRTWTELQKRYNPQYYAFLRDSPINIVLKRVLSLGILYYMFFSLAFPLFIKITLAYNREQLRRLELARQNVELEFSFLKSQVNPHFLFNTLNNIYSLIIHDKKMQAADTVARLSAFMRYSLHDSSAHQADVRKEIQLMNDYIALEKLRLNHTPVEAGFRTDQPGYQLPPLLLMPLLENAFKYCVDSPSSFIRIDLDITGGHLKFSCNNSFDPAANSSGGGIGVANVKKRLEQYYPGKYKYEVSIANDIYSVNLSIQLV